MKFLSVIILVLLQTFAYSQRGPLSKGNATTNNYYTNISYEFVNGKIIIPVSIEENLYQFLFDTGAPNLISSELLQRLQTKTVDSIIVTDANSKRKKMAVVAIPNLKIGDVSFENVSSLVYAYEENIIFDCFEIDGIIGSNMLKESIVQILPKENSLQITNNKKRLLHIPVNAAKLSLLGDQRSPYVWIKLIGEKSGKEQVLIDTGMNGLYDLSVKHHNLLKTKNIYNNVSAAIGSKSISLFGNADQNEQFRILMPSLEINNTTFKNILVETTSDNNSRIGSDIFKYGNVTIDFKHKRFYFDSFENTNDLSEKIAGFSPTLVDDKLVVGIIWDTDLKESLQLGDEIISINNIDFSNTNICDLVIEESIFKKSDSLNIVFKDSTGQLKAMVFEKKLPLYSR